MESIDDLSVSRNKIIINSTQKVSSRVLNSRNMMSVARTSYISPVRAPTGTNWAIMCKLLLYCSGRNHEIQEGR